MPALWCLSQGRPKKVISVRGFKEMKGWPPGFYRAQHHDKAHVVVLSELPVTRATHFLRLMGIDEIFRNAVCELHTLPLDSWEWHAAEPLILDLQEKIDKNLRKEKSMKGLHREDVERVYQRWRERVKAEGLEAGRKLGLDKGREEGLRADRREGERAMLVKQLRTRFGRLPRATVARVKNASRASLNLWIERILTAQSLAQVFADE